MVIVRQSSFKEQAMRINSVARRFERSFRSIMTTEVKKFKTDKAKEHAVRLLHTILKERTGLFHRLVVQSPERDIIPPFGYSGARYYYVVREIGIVNGRRIFFEDASSHLDLYKEKAGAKTNPPTVENINLSVTPMLVREVLEFLDKKRFSKRSADQLEVPQGFYVFEFSAQNDRGSPRVRQTMTMMPFEASNLTKAIEIMLMCPDFTHHKDFRDFKVYTRERCRKLNYKLRRASIMREYASLSDYEVST